MILKRTVYWIPEDLRGHAPREQDLQLRAGGSNQVGGVSPHQRHHAQGLGEQHHWGGGGGPGRHRVQ